LAADCIIVTKKLGHIYSSSNFCHENTWDEKRLLSSYNSAPMIVKAYHIENKCNDAPNIASTLPSSVVEPKIVQLCIVDLSMSELSGFADVSFSSNQQSNCEMVK
jgi:hypothetical protein